MDSLTARELPGTEDANGLFWSPDSSSIGFVAGDKLKRVDASGGAAQTVCDAPGFEGGSWSKDGVILFGSGKGGLRRVPATGGTPVPVTTASGGTNAGHRYPYFLPDGRSFLYTLTGTEQNTGGVFLSSLDSPAQTVHLVGSDAKAIYAPPRDGRPGYLLWIRDQSLMAQRFAVKSKRLEGDPELVVDSVATPVDNTGRRAAYWVSDTGLLVYRGGRGIDGFQLTWISRDGKPDVIAVIGAETQRTGDPSISPDGGRVALERRIAGNFDVWLYEMGRGVMTRLTFDAGRDWYPVWSPDGQEVAYSGERGGIGGIYMKAASGAGQEELLVKGQIRPSSWSRDGRYLLYDLLDGGGIWVLPLTGKAEDRKPFAYIKTPFRESHSQFSPDGKWVAYVSNESGRNEVYIQPFPVSGGKWQVSINGGDEPRWRGDGKELFFISGSELSAAGIRVAKDRVEIDPPRGLFGMAVFSGPAYHYDVSPDGHRFLILEPLNARFISNSPLTVISDWQAGLKK